MKNPVIYFSMINSVAELPELHNLSDAGAGFGLMGYTPASNTEMIVTGKDITPLPGIMPQPLLGNGGITPALLVHALLQLLRRDGYKVRVRIYNIALPVLPQIPASMNTLDRVEQWSCDAAGIDNLLHKIMLPNLQQEDRNNGISLIGECGVGGTTFSSLWFGLLLDNNLSVLGSTSVPEKLRKKHQLVSHLRQQVVQSNRPVCTQTLLSDLRWHDHFQTLVTGLFKGLTRQSRKNPVWLAGGLMFMAPWFMLCREAPQMMQQFNQCMLQATTRWVYSDQHQNKELLQAINNNLEVRLPQADFSRSRHDSIRIYEQGMVVEGCGLGGCLYLAESLGFTAEQIISVMDEFVDWHLACFQPPVFHQPHQPCPLPIPRGCPS